ncbi:LAFA_0E07096g1_1 [Lachancea sp. 'fantastica']|nr:LAFA_0E07096g1_1 [Lachancea sp. 'fantastica']
MLIRRTLTGGFSVFQGCTIFANAVGVGLSIAILSTGYHQSCFSTAALIVLTCGMSALAGAQLIHSFRKLAGLGWLVLLLQLLSLGSAIAYVKILLEKLPTSSLSSVEMHLAVAHISVLLAAMLANSLAVDLDFGSAGSNKHISNDLENGPDESRDEELDSNHLEISGQSQGKQKTVSMKNSAQTLTPDLENAAAMIAQQNWMNNYPSTYSSSENTSTHSVVKHAVELQASQMHDATSTVDVPSASGSIKTPKKSKMDVFSLMRSKSKLFKSPKVSEPLEENKLRYVTRLSTIHDSSKSLINVALNSQNFDASSKSVHSSYLFADTQKRPQLDEAALSMEKLAINRINNALLPPSLQGYEQNRSTAIELGYEKTPTTQIAPKAYDLTPPSSSTEDDIVDVLGENDLEDIPKIPDQYLQTDRPQTYHQSAALLHSVSLPEWQLNRSKLMHNERLIGQNTLELGPSLELKASTSDKLLASQGFSFPQVKPKLSFEDFYERESGDAVSELDVFLKNEDFEGDKSDTKAQMMSDVLRQEDLMISPKRLSKISNFNAGPHSPTKSVTSMFSNSASGSMKNPLKFGSVFTNAGNSNIPNQPSHSRSSSQVTSCLHSTSNLNTINYSTQSSPTKSGRLRRMSKKMSLSNISFRHENEDNVYGHERNNSVDFSYLYTLQNKHSPSKSLSSISRRNSTILQGDRTLRTASALFESKNEQGMENVNISLIPTLEQCDNREQKADDQESALSSSSRRSDTHYPRAVIGEYDREKWTTLQNLSLIDEP